MKQKISTLMVASMTLAIGTALMPLSATAKKPSPYVTVNCDAGQSIQAALDKANPSIPLTLTVQGTCQEDVNINRDSVTVNGVLGSTIYGTVAISGASHISMNNLTFTGPGQGIKVFVSDVNLDTVFITGNAADGLSVQQNSWVSLSNSEVTGNGNFGIYIQRPAFDANNSEISGNANDGVSSDMDGHSIFRNTVVSGNGGAGISLLFHSIAELRTNPELFDKPMSVTSNQEYGVYMREDSGLRITTTDVTIDGNVVGGIECSDAESSFANYGSSIADSINCTGF
jgi:hypothetical protein